MAMINKACIAIFAAESLDQEYLDYYHRLSVLIDSDLKLITPENTAKAATYKQRLTFLTDEEVLENIDLNRSTLNFPRARWYLQQLIKLSAADLLFRQYTTVIIVDGDTLVSKRALNFAKPVVNKIENKAYLKMFKLLGYEEHWLISAQELLSFNFSPIVNFGIWKRDTFRFCLSSSSVKLSEWINVIAHCNQHMIYQPESPIFSEYLLMFVAKMLQENITKAQDQLNPIRSFRRADLLWTSKKDVISCMGRNKYDMVAFEKNHSSTLFKKLIAQLFWHLSIDIK